MFTSLFLKRSELYSWDFSQTSKQTLVSQQGVGCRALRGPEVEDNTETKYSYFHFSWTITLKQVFYLNAEDVSYCKKESPTGFCLFIKPQWTLVIVHHLLMKSVQCSTLSSDCLMLEVPRANTEFGKTAFNFCLLHTLGKSYNTYQFNLQVNLNNVHVCSDFDCMRIDTISICFIINSLTDSW